MKSLLKLKFRQLRNALARGERKKFILFLLLGVFFILVLGFFFNKIFGYLLQLQEFPQLLQGVPGRKAADDDLHDPFFHAAALVAAGLAGYLFHFPRPASSFCHAAAGAQRLYLENAGSQPVTVRPWSFFSRCPCCSIFATISLRPCRRSCASCWPFFLFLASGVLPGIALGLVIPAFFSVRRLQPVLSVFSIILISSIVVFLRLLRPERFLNPSEIDNVLNYMGSLDLKVFYYFPFAWLARAMSLTAGRESAPYWKIIAVFVLLAGGAAGPDLLPAEKILPAIVRQAEPGRQGLLQVPLAAVAAERATTCPCCERS